MAPTPATGHLQLYTYFRSSCSWRVRIALEWKGIPYESIFVHLLKNEQNDEEYGQVNPMHQVPALVIDGQCLTQSLPIIEYLDDNFPDRPLLPKDPLQRFRVRQICEIIASAIQPMQNLAVLKMVSDYGGNKTDFAAFFIKKGLAAVEAILRETSGTYSVGDDVTMADACLVPQVASAERFNVDLEPYPNIRRICAALSELEPFKKAHAFAQDDCPDELRWSKL
ncbi:hypothetical protein RvY_16352 [Ramazzottius varieornatus]|uniref:maleylacetoacetate isomerase n=1 Tax=Ramazzottius varieornatus TaxID=947166 RepID=A0A1D1W100_RAMVA|nr:hypothetical protein RvY_16352 [Ramazzottius varieornatus]